MAAQVDGIGTTAYSYDAAGQVLTEDPPTPRLGWAGGPFASDTITNTYVNRLRTGLSLQQPTGVWTNAFGYAYDRMWDIQERDIQNNNHVDTYTSVIYLYANITLSF